LFREFKKAISRQIDFVMKNRDLFRVNVDKDKLWETYLNSFPDGSNPIFKERTEHDCNCCKQFIRAVGNMVAIIDGKVVSIWDVQVGGHYQVVSDAMSALVKSCPVDNIFLHTELRAGTDRNYQDVGEKIITWEHFYIQFPPELVCAGIDIGTKLSVTRSARDVMIRGLKELKVDAIDVVLELISQNSLYRGEEHTFILKSFLELKKKFDKVPVKDQDLFCWAWLKTTPDSVAKFRNTVIGTLVTDISDGVDLEVAVGKFEHKVAGDNYKRPTALVTQAMKDKARAGIIELGLMSALERRYANIRDITVNNILFADRNARAAINGDVFDSITIPEKIQNYDKVEEIGIEKFLTDVLPKAESIEVMFENKHIPNLVSLIAPVDPTAKLMFKWPNGFSWSYNGEVADSMRDHVKSAGGKVDGVLRFSIMWSGDKKDNSDLDAHCKEPTGQIYFSNKRVSSGGNLDVDITQPIGQCIGKPAVENITWPSLKSMKDGVYEFFVNQYRAQGSQGFSAEIEFDGQIFKYEYPRAVISNVQVAVVTLKNGKFTIKHKLDSTMSSKQEWGIKSQNFHRTSVIMMSPNHWDEKAIGNRHFFFMIDGCINSGTARGFYNEFLMSELDVHRKTLEMVGSKMQTTESEHQLSGLGFSSTQRNSILCRVKGSFNRIIKINF
jgi:hypothetical protein